MSKKFALLMIAGALLMTAAGYESAFALNPQPLPPRVMPRMTVLVAHTHQVYGPRRLNPQPLPPG